MSARHHARRGFSLLEAVVALALLGVTLPTIFSIFSDAALRATRAEDRLDTLRRAQDLVALSIAQFHGEVGSRSGTDAAATWRVETSYLPIHDRPSSLGETGPAPVQLTVAVRSQHGAEAHLDTLFLFQDAKR